MGRGVRPIESFGDDGLHAALELAESTGLLTDEVRQAYPEHFDTNNTLHIPKGWKPVFDTVEIDLHGVAEPVVVEIYDENYLNSEFED